MLQRLDSRGIALVLILEKVLNCKYDLIDHRSDAASQPGGFLFLLSCWGKENSEMVPNQENINMEGDQPGGYQPLQSHSHAQQPLQPQTCVQDHCPGETGLPPSVFLHDVHEMSLVHFKVLNYLSNVGLSAGNNTYR